MGVKGKVSSENYLIEQNKNISLSWDLLAVQWLRIHASTAGDIGSIPSQGTKILYAAWCDQKIKIIKNHKKECTGLICED